MKAKSYLLITFVFLSLSSGAQNPIKKIVITKSSDHVNIPGTKLFMILPDGFIVSSGIQGFVNDKIKARVQVIEYNTGTNFNEKNAENSFKSKGYSLLKIEDYNLNSYRGKLAFLKREETKESVLMLGFSDTTFTIVIVAHFTPNSAISEQLKKSLLSSYYDPSFMKEDPSLSAPYILNTADSKFKLVQAGEGVYIYSPNKELNLSKSTVIILATEFDENHKTEQLSKYGATNNAEAGMSNEKIIKTTPVELRNYEAYEAVAYGIWKDKKTLIYCLAVTNKSKTIIFKGIATEYFTENLLEFQRLGYSLQIK